LAFNVNIRLLLFQEIIIAQDINLFTYLLCTVVQQTETNKLNK